MVKQLCVPYGLEKSSLYTTYCRDMSCFFSIKIVHNAYKHRSQLIKCLFDEKDKKNNVVKVCNGW